MKNFAKTETVQAPNMGGKFIEVPEKDTLIYKDKKGIFVVRLFYDEKVEHFQPGRKGFYLFQYLTNRIRRRSVISKTELCVLGYIQEYKVSFPQGGVALFE